MTKLTVISEQAKPATLPLTSPTIIEPKPRAKLYLMKTAVVFGCVSLSVILALCLLFRTIEASRERRVVVSVPTWDDSLGDSYDQQETQHEPLINEQSTLMPAKAKPTVQPTHPTTVSSSFNKNNSGNFEIVVVTSCLVAGSCMRSSDCCNGVCAWVPGLSLPWCVQTVDKRVKETMITVIGTVGDDGSKLGTNRIDMGKDDSADNSDSSGDNSNSSSNESDEIVGKRWPNNENEWYDEINHNPIQRKNNLTTPRTTTTTPTAPEKTTRKQENESTKPPLKNDKIKQTSTQSTEPPISTSTDVIDKFFSDVQNNFNNIYKALA